MLMKKVYIILIILILFIIGIIFFRINDNKEIQILYENTSSFVLKNNINDIAIVNNTSENKIQKCR